MNSSELIRRANTIKLSRPEIWADIVRNEDELQEARFGDWYILGDIPPHYPVPSIVLSQT